MAIIAATLARFKQRPFTFLGAGEQVNAFFKGAGHTWRERLYDPANTVALFFLQILNGNTAINHLRHLSGQAVCSSSYSEARSRLPMTTLAGFVDSLFCNDSKSNQGGGSGPRWFGHRVFVADATNTATPDLPALQELWPQPPGQKPGCGFPVIKLLGLLDLATGLIVQLTLMSLNVHEMSQLPGLHAAIKAGDVLLADRGFCSFWHLALLAKSSAFSLFRIHQRQIVDFAVGRPHRGKKARRGKGKRTKGKRAKSQRGLPTSIYVKRLGPQDQLVKWVKPKERPEKWMSDVMFALMPKELLVRELRYRIEARGRRTREVTIVTTLLDPMRYPKREIAKLYGLRWEIETNFRHLKTTMKMDQLKCQSVDGVVKELVMFVLVYNLIRLAMGTAAERVGVDASRISFIDALRWLCALCQAPPSAGEMNLIVNPARPGRWQPRVLKRRLKKYPLMIRPRHTYTEPAMEQEVMC